MCIIRGSAERISLAIVRVFSPCRITYHTLPSPEGVRDGRKRTDRENILGLGQRGVIGCFLR